MFSVDFAAQEPQVICHPDYAQFIPEILKQLKPYNLTEHFILFSSGTTGGDLKGYALSKKALFQNADAVNAHFGLTPGDIWGLSLPVYHVGGLSVLARAHLLKNEVIDARVWEPEQWARKMEKVSITTIVPTQLYDLVKKKIKPSPALKYLIVGGDHLSSALKNEALKYGWPVIRTFGMSEVSSQLASSRTPEIDELEILPIHEVKIADERLLVKSSSLFTLEFTMGKNFTVTMAQDLCDPAGFYRTKDRALVAGSILTPLGRMGDEVKVAGHLVNLSTLKETLSSFLLEKNLFQQMEFALQEDERKGKKLVLLALPEALDLISPEEISALIRPAKIDEIQIVDKFERTSLGKLKKI